jgi:hypothetical protein|tara:strand:- start:250 stop:465 length:216 start_codon:yes stop_codon:yes gene_type:complete
MWSEVLTGLSIPLFSVGLYKLGKSSVRKDIRYTQQEITDTIKALEEKGGEEELVYQLADVRKQLKDFYLNY